MSDDFEALRGGALPAALDSWNIEDLKEYVKNLEAEIERCQAVIARKTDLTSAADALFKKS